MLRHIVLIGVIVVGLGALALLAVKHAAGNRSRLLTVCLDDAQGLRAQADVRVAGVEVGKVISVRAQPDVKSCLAQIQLRLKTPYELTIPRDAMVEIQTAGLLGAPYIQIDARSATGPPLREGESLHGVRGPTPVESLQTIVNTLKQGCGSGVAEKAGGPAGNSAKPGVSTPSTPH